MFKFIVDILKKKSNKKDSHESRAIFLINGMHCVSCSLNIDAALEEKDGVTESKTSYAKAETSVLFDSSKVTIPELQKSIEDLGYSVVGH